MRERDKGTARGAVTTGGHYDNMENKRDGSVATEN